MHFTRVVGRFNESQSAALKSRYEQWRRLGCSQRTEPAALRPLRADGIALFGAAERAPRRTR
eukprot:6205774-Pleurochrysis_carterae.AAC.6